MTLLTTPASGSHVDFDLDLPNGRLRARRYGPDAGPLTLFLPGMSANLSSFEYICERLSDGRRRLVALDLRGRGRSEVTPPGTYGLARHAEDVLAAADRLGAERFTLVGHSMGGGVTMVTARLAPERLQGVVLIDACGEADPSSMAPITAALGRLGGVYPSVDAVADQLRAIGIVEQWNEYWDRYIAYDTRECEGGVTTRTSRDAVLEDGLSTRDLTGGEDGGIAAAWRHLTMPALLIRASREMVAGTGYIVPARERNRFLAAVPTATACDVDANHYTIAMHDGTVSALRAFLDEHAPAGPLEPRAD